MFVSESISVNEKGNLTVSNADLSEIAERFSTPLYVMSEDGIRKNIRKFKSALKKNYGENAMMLYASKAFCCKEMCRIAKSEEIGLDVVSLGEFKTAVSVGFPADKIYFHGNNKLHGEIFEAVKSDIGAIVADNFDELEEINAISSQLNKTTNILLRIKPGIDAHTHDFIRTGQIDSKFGFALENGEAFKAVKYAFDLKNINLLGLHCHIGSQIFESEPFCSAADVMLSFFDIIRTELGITLGTLNLGGGFGVNYTDKDNAPDPENVIDEVAKTVKHKCEKLNFPIPYILIEPGRSIVACEGVTLYTVGNIKNIENVRKYVSVDGGIGDNPRYALYNAEYSAVIVRKALNKADDVVTVAGKYCESGDIIQKDILIQKAEKGDLLAVFSTGAYNFSMASDYNRNPRPAVVMVHNGKVREIVRRETFEDISCCDI